MSSLSGLLKDVSRRDVVPLYFVPGRGLFIITGTAGTHGGALVADEDGQIVRSFTSKGAAIVALRKDELANQDN